MDDELLSFGIRRVETGRFRYMYEIVVGFPHFSFPFTISFAHLPCQHVLYHISIPTYLIPFI